MDGSYKTMLVEHLRPHLVSSTIDPEIGIGMVRPFCCDCCIIGKALYWIDL
jgi:hypothetical protein